MTNFTMAEAATELRKSTRWLREWLAGNPEDIFGRPYCSKLGRTKVFREANITRILDATMDETMPLYLRRPRKSPNWSIRGKYLDVAVERSTGTPKKAVAEQQRKKLEGQIERGEYKAARRTNLLECGGCLHEGGAVAPLRREAHRILQRNAVA
jgi:hypothetical protein